MSSLKSTGRTRAQESTSAIERIYVTMRHLFNRGFYKPSGVSGRSLRDALLLLRPEIYGSIADSKVELNGLTYVMDRLPLGIEQCRFVNLTADEGYAKSHFEVIIPPKRRRNCYRIDAEQMNIEITRGRSDIYDILTHLTFLYNEADKICKHVLEDQESGVTSRDWQKLEAAVLLGRKLSLKEREVALIHTANIIGRTFEETLETYRLLISKQYPERFLEIIYWLGKLSLDETVKDEKRAITFSPVLRERVGHHIYGEKWANVIKKTLQKNGLLERELHIISANMHSVLNSLFVPYVEEGVLSEEEGTRIFEKYSKENNSELQQKVFDAALEYGMIYLEDHSGTNINVQIFDAARIDLERSGYEDTPDKKEKPVIFVMDYAFGEQAYETIDELLKPYKPNSKNKKKYLNVASISIMGKAGILNGKKGDIMIPSAHVFEGTADNYPFTNELCKKDFDGCEIDLYEGTMVTVLGTSLQNKDVLKFFHNSTWNVIGLEMEGAHYQKAIQSASRIRKSISEDIKVRYAYYASDNPLETGSTLASGGLGVAGVKPTYVITRKILEQILS